MGSPSFLIVDDDDAIRRLVAAVLRRERYETDDAANGKEAIEKLAARSYDALFLDLMMPVCDGYEVLAFLRRQAGRQSVILMTAADTRGTSDLDGTLVRRILRKPFDLADVLEAASTCLGPSSVGDHH